MTFAFCRWKFFRAHAFAHAFAHVFAHVFAMSSENHGPANAVRGPGLSAPAAKAARRPARAAGTAHATDARHDFMTFYPTVQTPMTLVRYDAGY